MYEYEDNHARYYDLCYTAATGDIGFYVQEAKRSGSPVLELGCGTGRILIPTAEAGVSIVGLDASSAMLGVARTKTSEFSSEVQSRIELIEGDMRTFSLDRQFKLVTIPFRAFLHILTPEEQRKTIERIHEHLDDGGRLILNIFDTRLDLVATPLGGIMKRLNDFIDPATGHKMVVWASDKYDLENQVIYEERVFEEIDDNGKVLSRVCSPLTLCWIYRREMQYLLELSGFKIDALYGDFNRGPFRYGGEQIWVVSKA